MQLTGQASALASSASTTSGRPSRTTDFRNSVVLTLVFTLISSILGQNTLGLTLAALMRAPPNPVRSVTGPS